MGNDRRWITAVIVLLLTATGCINSKSNAGAGGTGGTPSAGQTEFVSADPGGPKTVSGTAGATAGNTDAETDGSGSMRTVERGDIYRVLGDGRILNLNSFRGLQVIDVRDPSAPVIEGRLALTGSPVEMYVAEDRAVVLLNNYQEYYGHRYL